MQFVRSSVRLALGSALALTSCALVQSSCGRVRYASDDAALDALPSVDAHVSLDSASRDVALFDTPSLDAPSLDAPSLDASSLDALGSDAVSLDDAAAECVHIESVGGSIASTDGHAALGSGPFTFEAWVRTPASLSTRTAVILGNREAGTSYRGYLFGQYAGVVFAQLSDTPNVRCGPMLVDEAWHHIAFVRDTGGALRCYVDFVSYVPDSTSSGRDLPYVASLVIGNDNASGGTPLDAGLWMARVWRAPRDVVALAATSSTRLGGGSDLLFEVWLDDRTMPTSVPVFNGASASASIEPTARWASGCPVP